MIADDGRERARTVWDVGDYEPTSRQLQAAASTLVETLGVGPGHRVLDVGTGHGNCAIAAARRSAEVVATDVSPVMIARARERVEAVDLPIRWEEADATHLSFDDGTFDRVTSVFGAIFATDHARAVSEAVRVLRPGGMVGFTSWVDEGFSARLASIGRRYAPPDNAAGPDYTRWGDRDHVRQLFAQTGCELAIHRRTLTFRFPSWGAWREAFEAHGIFVTAKKSMPPDRFEAMLNEVQAAAKTVSYQDGDDAVCYDADYLEIVAARL